MNNDISAGTLLRARVNVAAIKTLNNASENIFYVNLNTFVLVLNDDLITDSEIFSELKYCLTHQGPAYIAEQNLINTILFTVVSRGEKEEKEEPWIL